MGQQITIVDYVRRSTFIKFGLVGASGVVVNNGILWVLTRNGMGDVAASALATECAIVSNFIGNSLWTWGDQDKQGWQKRLFYFQLISLFAGALTVLLFWMLHNIFSLPLLVANTTAIFVTFLVNYVMNKRITWAKTMRMLTPIVLVSAALLILCLSASVQAIPGNGNGTRRTLPPETICPQPLRSPLAQLQPGLRASRTTAGADANTMRRVRVE